MREPVRGVSRAFLLAAFLAPCLSAPAPTGLSQEGSDAHVDPRLGRLVEETVRRASRRLADPGCAQLLFDFDDLRTGRPLAETLAASGRSPGNLLGTLRFYDGDLMVQCRWRDAWAWVAVGTDAVFVCRSRFVKLATKNEKLAMNILVHEALHTLGLGENPPSSEEITAAVVRRCGR
ncbi:MAG: hypothetical protein KJ062_00315 [Thermoanaerobaculia bacterium]|nr:hypothetical protein [Thermoanaerobaculia bacterium]